MTLDELKAAYPDVYSAIDKAAYDRGLADGQKKTDEAVAKEKEQSFTAGAEAERSRIKAIEDLAIPGHETLIATLKFDGTTKPEEAAVAVIAAEKKVREGVVDKIAADARKPLPQTDVSTEKPAGAGEDENQPLETRAQATWDKDPAIRAEFGDDFKAYLAFREADASGRVKIYKGKGGN